MNKLIFTLIVLCTFSSPIKSAEAGKNEAQEAKIDMEESMVLPEDILKEILDGGPEKLDLLRTRRISVNAKDQKGNPLIILLIACSNACENFESIRSLVIDYKADLNSTNSKGKTPFKVAEDLSMLYALEHAFDLFGTVEEERCHKIIKFLKDPYNYNENSEYCVIL